MPAGEPDAVARLLTVGRESGTFEQLRAGPATPASGTQALLVRICHEAPRRIRTLTTPADRSIQ